MHGSIDLFTLVLVLVAVALLTTAFRRVSSGNARRGVKLALLLVILAVGGVMTWTLSLAFRH